MSNKKQNNKNNYNYKKCAFCGAMRLKEEMHLVEIFINNGRKSNWYCSDKPCSLHAQYAAEG